MYMIFCYTFIYMRVSGVCLFIKHFVLTVPIPRDEEDPIPSSLSHVLLRAHESTRLQCAETGHWMRGNHTLKSGNKYHIINSTLVIRNTGKYAEKTCKYGNVCKHRLIY